MDKLNEAVNQVYGWSVNDKGQVVPPHRKYPLPSFVTDRIYWLSKEMQSNPFTLVGGIEQLVDIDDEEKLRKDWEFGADSPYMSVTKEYREWLEDPLYENFRKIAVMIAFIYY